MRQKESGSKAVVGVFSYVDDAVRAAKEARSRKWDYRVYSPCALDDLEEVVETRKSPVRIFSLVGAIAGLIAGFGLTVWCSMDFPLRTSAKPVISLPAFVAIGFECTVLFSALATFLGLAIFCRLPYVFRKMGYYPRFSDDRFGVVVACAGRNVEAVGEMLRKAGAEEVNVKDAL